MLREATEKGGEKLSILDTDDEQDDDEFYNCLECEPAQTFRNHTAAVQHSQRTGHWVEETGYAP
jgi:hypothetical protein